MFLFTEFQLYGIIAVAVLVSAPGIWLIKKRGRTLFGQAVSIDLKPFHRGNVAGGILFGIGWSITRMCLGPILSTSVKARCMRWLRSSALVSLLDLSRTAAPLRAAAVKVDAGEG
jgi:uncharacterized membrane protein YedE/YeeE